MKFDLKLMLGASAIAMMSLTGGASAQDCPRGSLDSRYCDADGDLVADIPNWTRTHWSLPIRLSRIPPSTRRRGRTSSIS